MANNLLKRRVNKLIFSLGKYWKFNKGIQQAIATPFASDRKRRQGREASQKEAIEEAFLIHAWQHQATQEGRTFSQRGPREMPYGYSLTEEEGPKEKRTRKIPQKTDGFQRKARP